MAFSFKTTTTMTTTTHESDSDSVRSTSDDGSVMSVMRVS